MAEQEPVAKEIAMYVRVSKEELSTDQQKVAVIEVIKSMGIDPDKVMIYEETQSAKDIVSRDVFVWLLDKIRRKQVEMLFVYSVDRLSRDIWDVTFSIRTIKDSGCKLYFAAPTQRFLNDMPDDEYSQLSKDFNIILFGMIAHMERASIRFRTKARMVLNKERGIKSGRKSYNLPKELLEEVWQRHNKGESWIEIAKTIKCPKCQGKGCRSCKKKGHINKDTIYDHVMQHINA